MSTPPGVWTETLQTVLLSALPQPIVAIGLQANVVYANPAAEQLFEQSLVSLKKQNLEALVSPSDALMPVVFQAQRTLTVVNEYDVELAFARKPPRRVDLTVAPINELSGGVLLVFQLRSIAAAIDRQFLQRHVTQSLSNMAAILAHEIKNPLAGIRGAAQLLEASASESDRSLTRLICDETDRIRNLVNRTEIFSDMRPVTPKPVNVHELLDHVRRLAQSGFASHVSFVEIYDPSLPPIAGDRDKLIQVFLNLIKNAAEATRDQTDAEIALHTSYRGGLKISGRPGGLHRPLPLEIAIRDNGRGISPEIMQNVFEPFVTSKAKGQGLGLAISAKIVSDHGGTIEFESAQRRTTFRVHLPVFQDNAGAAA